MNTKYHQQILYLFFGVLTSLVNYGVFALALDLLGNRAVLAANALAFVLATVFAFVTNKRFVFHAPDWRPAAVARGFAAFTGARLFSFGLEELGLWVCAAQLSLGRYTVLGLSGLVWAKVLLSFLSVLLNYGFSRYWVFRKR